MPVFGFFELRLHIAAEPYRFPLIQRGAQVMPNTNLNIVDIPARTLLPGSNAFLQQIVPVLDPVSAQGLFQSPLRCHLPILCDLRCQLLLGFLTCLPRVALQTTSMSSEGINMT